MVPLHTYQNAAGTRDQDFRPDFPVRGHGKPEVGPLISEPTLLLTDRSSPLVPPMIGLAPVFCHFFPLHHQPRSRPLRSPRNFGMAFYHTDHAAARSTVLDI